MLRARPRLALTAAFALGLLAAAVAHPVLADGGLPTPLPDAASGPDTQALVDTAESFGLTCQDTSFGGRAEWACFNPNTSVALFVAFGGLSIAFWAYFRNKPVES